MNKEQIEALRKGTTPGPWRYDENMLEIYGDTYDVLVVYKMQFPSYDGPLIAAAPTLAATAIAALDEVERLRAEREQILSDGLIPSDQRIKYEAIAARILHGKASQQEASDAILAVVRANEKLALLLKDVRAARDYSVSKEWVEKNRALDDGVTVGAGST